MLQIIAKPEGASPTGDVTHINRRLLASSSKPARAVLAARIAEAAVQPEFSSQALARLFDVSVTYVNAARRLSEAERRSVEAHERPLLEPRPIDATVDGTVAALVRRVGAARVWEALLAAL